MSAHGRETVSRQCLGGEAYPCFHARPEPCRDRLFSRVVRRAFEVHDELNKVRHACERREIVRRQCLAGTKLTNIFNNLQKRLERSLR